MIGKPMTGHNSSVNSVAFSPDGSLIASAFRDDTIHFWNGFTGETSGEPLTGHEGGVRCVAFSPDGSLVASGGVDGTIRIWDVQTRLAVGEPLGGHTGTINSVSFSPDGQFIYSCSWDKTIRCWDVLSHSPVGAPLISHTNGVLSISVSRDDHRIVSGSRDRSIRVWDAQAFHWDRDHLWLGYGSQYPQRIPGHDPDDGWIRGSEGDGLYLWVPSAHRKAVCRIEDLCIPQREDHPIRIEWDKLCHGGKWIEIHE